MDVSVAEWLAWLTSNCGRIGAIGSSPSNGLRPNMWGQKGFNPLCQCVYIYVCIVKPDIQTIHRCSQSSIHIHTYIHTCIHTYIHTCIHTLSLSFLPSFLSPSINQLKLIMAHFLDIWMLLVSWLIHIIIITLFIFVCWCFWLFFCWVIFLFYFIYFFLFVFLVWICIFCFLGKYFLTCFYHVRYT